MPFPVRFGLGPFRPIFTCTLMTTPDSAPPQICRRMSLSQQRTSLCQHIWSMHVLLRR